MQKAILTALIALLIGRLISEMLVITRRHYLNLLDFTSFVMALWRASASKAGVVCVGVCRSRRGWAKKSMVR